MTPSAPQQVITAGNAPTPPPVFASSPTGKKPQQKSTTATFLGSGSMPTQTQAPAKTLLGA